MLIGLFGDFRNRHRRVPVTQLIASARQQAKVCFVHVISGRPAMSSQGWALSHLRSLLLVPLTLGNLWKRLLARLGWVVGPKKNLNN